jgi:DNA replication protein DnaC
MINPQMSARWLAEFTNRHSLTLPEFPEGSVAAGRVKMAADYADKHIPLKFVDAFPTLPDVEAWVAAVTAKAVTESARRGQQVVTVHDGPSLLMLGVTGCGKTSEGYGAMRVLSLLGIHNRWLLLTAADLYARLRPRHGIDSEEEFQTIANAPVLVVDDLGAAKNSEFVEEVNYRLVNHRYELARPTVFTSNFQPSELRDVLGDRVTSRLREFAKQVWIQGVDRRRAA